MASSEQQQQQARGVMEQIEKLSLEQIRQVKEQVDSEVSLLQDSIANIRTAASRFEAASKAVNNLSTHPPAVWMPDALGTMQALQGAENREKPVNNQKLQRLVMLCFGQVMVESGQGQWSPQDSLLADYFGQDSASLCWPNSPKQDRNCRIQVKNCGIQDSGTLKIPYLQIALSRVLRRYAAQIPPNRIETAGYRMDGNKEEGSSSEDRQPIPIAHEIGESSGQAEKALQVVTAVTMFKQLMENPRFMEFIQSSSIAHQVQGSFRMPRIVFRGKNLLVPLTASLYVPGMLANVDKLLIDVGTGYYVEKTMDAAKDYCERKINFLKANHDKLLEVAAEKSNIADQVSMVPEEHAIGNTERLDTESNNGKTSTDSPNIGGSTNEQINQINDDDNNRDDVSNSYAADTRTDKKAKT
ncbi:hypothetical protein L7F22_050005 [Adiantum nelumboides]|nr:hypothetical protein [Adiantum nelumboides]